jgi:sugar O-acyltransferase (sialic acid O-acetyltransferase NeuD family)
MIVIGAKGHAKDILCIIEERSMPDKALFFYDNVSCDLPLKMYGTYTILKSFEEAKEILKEYPNFVLGIGNPKTRQILAQKFIAGGGNLQSVFSNSALIGKHEVDIGRGVNIMANVFISNSVTIGEGALINAGVMIHHDANIGSYVEVSPGAIITGGVEIGDLSYIGSGATILPKVKIGKNVIVGAGAVVTKSISDNTKVKGVPAISF